MSELFRLIFRHTRGEFTIKQHGKKDIELIADDLIRCDLLSDRTVDLFADMEGGIDLIAKEEGGNPFHLSVEKVFYPL